MKRAISHPRKQRRRSLWSDILLCFLGCGRARLLSLRPASRSVRVASRSDQGLPQGLIAGCLEVSCAGLPRGPREQTLRPKFSILGGFLALPTETSFTTSVYYSKYEVSAIENLLVWDPFKMCFSSNQF